MQQGDGTMDLNRMTQRSQEALQNANTTAVRLGHVEVDGEHLLLALLSQDDGLIPRLFERMQVDVPAFRNELEGELGRRPKVTGTGEGRG